MEICKFYLFLSRIHITFERRQIHFTKPHLIKVHFTFYQMTVIDTWKNKNNSLFSWRMQKNLTTYKKLSITFSLGEYKSQSWALLEHNWGFHNLLYCFLLFKTRKNYWPQNSICCLSLYPELTLKTSLAEIWWVSSLWLESSLCSTYQLS